MLGITLFKNHADESSITSSVFPLVFSLNAKPKNLATLVSLKASALYGDKLVIFYYPL